MKMVICSLLIFMGILPLSAYIDLEENAQDFILETQQIILPEYPNAFNPSIVRWKGELWMSFRIFTDPKNVLVSSIGILKLNELFEPIGNSYILHCLDRSQKIVHSLEDARLITTDDHLYIVYNDHQEPSKRWLRRVCFAELDFDGKDFQCKNHDIFLHYEGASHKIQEKNWTPFVYQGEILFIYSLYPSKFMKPLMGCQTCQTVFNDPGNIKWDWGEIRGGTPALLLNGDYISFFHSLQKLETKQSNGKSMLHYFMGAYTFSSQPPFSITRISKEPIMAKDFYKPRNHYPWGPRRVVYPCGFVADKNFIWVSYGREDCEMWIAKINRNKLIDSLVPVSN